MVWIVDGEGNPLEDGLLEPIDDGIEVGTFVAGGFVLAAPATTDLLQVPFALCTLTVPFTCEVIHV